MRSLHLFLHISQIFHNPLAWPDYSEVLFKSHRIVVSRYPECRANISCHL